MAAAVPPPRRQSGGALLPLQVAAHGENRLKQPGLQLTYQVVWRS